MHEFTSPTSQSPIDLMKCTLIHRYDNKPDVFAVEQKGFSDVYDSVDDDSFELLVVVPTRKANTDIAVVADPVSGQYQPKVQVDWPGRPDEYVWRVEVENVRYTTYDRVSRAVREAGGTWQAQWKVNTFDLDEETLRPEGGFLEVDIPSSTNHDASLTEEVSDSETYSEGTTRDVTVNAYERSDAARDACIDHYGAGCQVCGVEFGKRYGPEAEGYIHVHHLIPLSQIDETYEVDPVEDLRPVCPNCHAVIHMGGESRSIDEVQEMMGAN